MGKYITFFLVMFIGSAMLSAIIEGGNGFASTTLDGAISETDAVITVISTEGFNSSDYIVIGNERIPYAAKTATEFTGCSRSAQAVDHADGSQVYTADASAINHALGFNIAATSDSMGWWAVVSVPVKFFTITLPRIVNLNWAFLQGDLAIIGWFFFAAGAGLIITLGLALAGTRRI